MFDPSAAEPRMEVAPVPIRETWEAMEKLHTSGLARHIGVGNFPAALLMDLLAYASVPPAVLQVELHPYLSQEELVRFAHSNGIHVTGFSPLGSSSYRELSMSVAGARSHKSTQHR